MGGELRMRHNSESVSSGPVWARVREGAADHHQVIAAPVGEQEGSVPWEKKRTVWGEGVIRHEKLRKSETEPSKRALVGEIFLNLQENNVKMPCYLGFEKSFLPRAPGVTDTSIVAQSLRSFVAIRKKILQQRKYHCEYCQ